MLKSYKSLDKVLCISDCYRVEDCKVISFNLSDNTCKYYYSYSNQIRLIEAKGVITFLKQPLKFEGIQDLKKVSDCSIMTTIVLPDDHIAFGCNWDNKIYVNNLYDWSREAILPSNSYTDSLGALKNGSLISGSRDCVLRIWDINKKVIINSLRGHNNTINKILVSKNGEIVSASSDTTILVWNQNDGSIKFNLTAHSKGVDDIVLLKDGNLISSSSSELSLKLWNTNTWSVISSYNVQASKLIQLNNGDISLFNGKSSGGGRIQVIDRLAFSVKLSSVIKTHWVFSIAEFDNNRIVECSAADYVLRIHDLNNFQVKLDSIAHTNRVYAMATLKNGYFLSAGWDSIIIWK